MAGNTEEAIARVQTEAAYTQGLQKHHKSTIVYLGERTFIYMFALAFIGLVILGNYIFLVYYVCVTCYSYFNSPDLGIGKIKKDS